MSWAAYHSQSELHAGQAEEALRQHDAEKAAALYRMAAEEETEALGCLEPEKPRTLGITAVSAAALWYKAKDLHQAQTLAYRGLSTQNLPPFAEQQLKELLQTIWSEEIRAKAGIKFTPGEVLVSVRGGDVVVGGAPLDLIVRKVDEVNRIFYRTIEMLLNRPFRRRGPPSSDIQEQFRPWLFQAATGSYQFAVRVEQPKQMELWPEARPEVQQITQTFLDIVRTTADDPQGVLADIVPDKEYRDTFLKLTRSLAPTGKTFERLEISSPSGIDSRPAVLISASRDIMNRAIRETRDADSRLKPVEEVVKLRGTLRGLQLDSDWIEINEGGEDHRRLKIYKVSDTVDDVIGPMVNHKVVVDAVMEPTGRYLYRDIEMEE